MSARPQPPAPSRTVGLTRLLLGAALLLLVGLPLSFLVTVVTSLDWSDIPITVVPLAALLAAAGLWAVTVMGGGVRSLVAVDARPRRAVRRLR